MSLIDLPAVEFVLPNPRLAPELMADGPCAGRHEHVPGDQAECWVRVGKPQKVGVETQMWARYDRATPGRFVYSGITVTTAQLEAGLRAAQAAGHTHGETYGA